jgi:hypothetical protein
MPSEDEGLSVTDVDETPLTPEYCARVWAIVNSLPERVNSVDEARQWLERFSDIWVCIGFA